MRRALIPSILILIVATSFSSAVAAVTTRFVNNAVTCNDSTLDSTVTPYCSIQPALDNSSDGDIIQVAAGTYSGTGAFVVDSFDVDITINGAGPGLTEVNGETTRGGIRISGHDATITGLTVVFATVEGSGAGITIQNPDQLDPYPRLHLEDVWLIANTSSGGDGAGILAAGRVIVDLERVKVVDNDATDGGAGAGMWIGTDSTVTVIDSEFNGNQAASGGGGIAVTGGSRLSVYRTVFQDNLGPAIESSSADNEIVVSDSTFIHNARGINFADGAVLEVSGSYFVGNFTNGPGGAIFDATPNAAVIANSTFYLNESGTQGGAIATSGVLVNSSIGGNTADIRGGGVATNGYTGPKLRNTILYGNGAPLASDCYLAVSEGYNLIGNPTDCALSGDTTGNLLASDPGWALPADNGGPTFTMAIPTGSVARDAGNPDTPGTGGTACELIDQRGFLRSDVRCDMGAFEFGAGPTVIRYAGGNRYATAVAVAAGDFPTTEQLVFVATGFNFPDALAGAAAAGLNGVPLLLLDSGIPGPTATELTRLDPSLISILGGTGAVSDTTKDGLEAYADSVERVFGTNRYRTAVEISKKAFVTDGSADVIYVATGLGFADALAAGPAAAAGNGPVLLVPGTSLPQEVADEIVRLTPNRIVVVGGTSVVSNDVLTALDALQIGDTVERIAGNNRYATAVAISQDAFPGGTTRAYIATGLNFPDALAGAAAAGAYGAPVLLVPGTSLPAEVSAEITRLGAKTIVILGGTAVVSTGVEDALKTLIGAS